MSGLLLCILLVFGALRACAVWLLMGGLDDANDHEGGAPLPPREDWL